MVTGSSRGRRAQMAAASPWPVVVTGAACACASTVCRESVSLAAGHTARHGTGRDTPRGTAGPGPAPDSGQQRYLTGRPRPRHQAPLSRSPSPRRCTRPDLWEVERPPVLPSRSPAGAGRHTCTTASSCGHCYTITPHRPALPLSCRLAR